MATVKHHHDVPQLQVDRSYNVGRVHVVKHRLDWAQIGPGFDDLADITEFKLLSTPDDDGHYYINPAYRVTAAADVLESEFLKVALRACILWKKEFSRKLGRGLLRRLTRRFEHTYREKVLSGILILRGRLAHIKRLNDGRRC